jgi:hypothetical protein
MVKGRFNGVVSLVNNISRRSKGWWDAYHDDTTLIRE